MSQRRSSADLGPTAEALLGAFPFPERDWERDARAIEARLSEAGGADDGLLAAPLPPEPGEGLASGASATTTPLTNSGVRTQSLAEIARRSVEKKQAEEREMARASLAIAATSARAAPAVVPAPLPPPALSAGQPATQLPVTRIAAAPSAFPKLALAAPLLALAAAALLWMRRPAEATPPVVSPPLVATSEATPTPMTSALAAASSPHSEPLSAPRGIDPNTLPSEAAPRPAEVALKATVGGAPPSAGASSSVGKASASEARPATVAALAAPAAKKDDSEKKVEPTLPPDAALRPADSGGGELPAKPSSGAVQAALGTVLSGARHCVAGDDAPSSAVVLFGSDGRVQSVSVSGPAAGKAAAACIQGQLTKARVQPFAASSFSVNATIRPD